jgi:hypothetical protein
MRKHLAVAALVSSVMTTSALAVDALNLASSFDTLKAKLGSGSPGSIVVLGDSISFRSGSYLPVFRQLMQQYYGDGGPGYASISTGTNAGLYSGALDYGVINGDNNPYNSLDGLWTNLTSAGYGHSDQPRGQRRVDNAGFPAAELDIR